MQHGTCCTEDLYFEVLSSIISHSSCHCSDVFCLSVLLWEKIIDFHVEAWLNSTDCTPLKKCTPSLGSIVTSSLLGHQAPQNASQARDKTHSLSLLCGRSAVTLLSWQSCKEPRGGRTCLSVNKYQVWGKLMFYSMEGDFSSQTGSRRILLSQHSHTDPLPH